MSDTKERTCKQIAKERGIDNVKRVTISKALQAKLHKLADSIDAQKSSGKFRLFAEMTQSKGINATAGSKAIGASLLVSDKLHAERIYYALVLLNAITPHFESTENTIRGNLKKVCSPSRNPEKYKKESFPEIPKLILDLIEKQASELEAFQRSAAEERVANFHNVVGG